MKNLASHLAILALALIALPSRADMVGTLNSGSLDFRAPTHILVIGYSHGMGNQFAQAAVGAAQRYRDLYPGEQVVLIRNRETGGNSDLAQMTGLGVRIVEANQAPLTGAALVQRLLRYSRIESLDFFGHSAALLGLGLQGAPPVDRFYPRTPGIEKVRSKLAPGAYAFLHGCNGAFVFAPYLSKLWGIPVASSLTSTDFQELSQDGNWYTNNPGQYPSGTQWVGGGDFNSHYRLKPDNHPYEGIWGSFRAGGLPFYKFFCNYTGGEDDCYRAMARSLYVFPSVVQLNWQSSEEDFKVVLQDFLCPNDAHGQIRHECTRALEDSTSTGNELFSPFRGNPLECDMRGCNVRIQCSNDENGGPSSGGCVISAPENSRPRTLIQEYKRYLRGFELLERK